MPSDNSPSPDSQTSTNSPPKKRRRWLRRTLWPLLIGTIILLPLLNGPIFRKVVDWQLRKVLHNFYLKGDFEVNGTILSGVELSNVDLAGSRNIRSLKFDRAEVDYTIPPFLKGNWGEGLTMVHLFNPQVVFDTSKDFPTNPDIEAKKAAKRAKKKAKNKPSTLWPNLDALLQNDLLVENLDLTIKSPEKQFLDLDQFTLQLLEGSGKITADQITYPNGQETQNLNAQLKTSGEQIIDITALELAEQLSIEQLTVFPPSDPKTPPRLAGQVRLLGGKITAEQLSPTQSTAKLVSGEIDLSALSTLLDKDIGLAGTITKLDATFDREAPHPVTGTVSTAGLTYKDYASDTVETTVRYRPEEVLIEALKVTAGDNSIEARGNYLIKTQQVDVQATIQAPNLQQLATNFELPVITGSINGKVDFKRADRAFTGTTANLIASSLTFQDYSLAKVILTANTSDNGALAFDLDADIDAEQTNTFKATGEFDPRSKQLKVAPVIKLDDLAKLSSALPEAPPINGTASAEGKIFLQDGKLDQSQLKATVNQLTYKGASVSSINVAANTTAPNQLDCDLLATLKKNHQLQTNGTFNLDTKGYNGQAKLALPTLASLHPLLAAIDRDERPTGKLDLAWSGSGSITKKNHQGTAEIPDFSLKLDGGKPVAGKLQLAYAPDNFHLTNLNLRSADLSVSGAAHLSEKRLDVESLRLFNGEKSIARAEISAPFDLRKLSDLNAFLKQPGKLSVKIDSDQLKLAELIGMTGKPATVSATINTKIDINGTLADPTGTGDLDVLQLRSTKSTDLAPADIRLDFNLGAGKLSLDGKIEQPEIQPITIKGHTPLKIDQFGSFADQSIDLALKLPETDLALVKKYVPDLNQAAGTIAADIRVSGTTSTPNLAGDLIVKSPLLKWKRQKIPTLSDMHVHLHLKGERLHIKHFNGYLAGGRLNIGGNANFDTLANPILDIALNAKQALIFRDDSVSLRANAEVKLAGAYDKAALTGKIGITQSRFFREIEILPIGLPRSSPTPAAPRAPSFGTKKEIGVDAAPLKDWTIDVAIVTDDPFLIRSNLARADITSDLNITGTLGKPVPQGKIELNNGRATLPFSDMETTQGALTFSPKTGFDPEINFRAKSKVQDYQINLIAYGRASAPKNLISSDPPLPESEAIALLATGSKSSDLSDSEVIAGDAALLLIDKIRRKYAKGTPIERRPGSLRELLDFKAGQIDGRTGKRSASASLELTDHVYLLGNVNVEGDYRGLVKLLFRFK